MTADPFRPDAGPYVLDALAAEDRSAFEQHLRGCDGCRAAVDEVAALPALLDLVPPEVIGRLGAGKDSDPPLSLDGPGDPQADDVPRRLVDDLAGRRSAEPPESLLEDLQAAAHRDLRRRRRSRALAAAAVMAAAAAVAVVLAVLPGLPWSTDRVAAERVELSAVVDSPMSAEVSLSSTDWGTRIVVDCRYRSTDPAGTTGTPGTAAPGDAAAPDRPYGGYGVVPGANDYSLVVTDVEGRDEEVATWSARPGTRMSVPASTSLPRERIAGIELRSAQGRALLQADLGEAQRR